MTVCIAENTRVSENQVLKLPSLTLARVYLLGDLRVPWFICLRKIPWPKSLLARSRSWLVTTSVYDPTSMERPLRTPQLLRSRACAFNRVSAIEILCLYLDSNMSKNKHFCLGFGWHPLSSCSLTSKTILALLLQFIIGSVFFLAVFFHASYTIENV